MNDSIDFTPAFEALTGNLPFPWQEDLYKRLIGNEDQFPEQCAIPTGLGKTAIIPIWLIALANDHTKVPRRLVYIVNRRTVVDQATREAEKLRDNLCKPEIKILKALAEKLHNLCAISPKKQKLINLPNDPPLAISTLRGQFADNGEWCADPARPAIVVGTIDMIGSRLLFSGYGIGRARKPLHAGFLGQDTLIVHDEAHLEPAFQDLLIAIQKEQSEGRIRDYYPLRVMELTATSRNASTTDDSKRYKEKLVELSGADRKHKDVKKRIYAKKEIHLHPIDDEKQIADEITDQARAVAKKHPESAILIFVRKVEDVEKITKKLPKDATLQLTGTLRGKERDELVEKPVFQWFFPESNRKENIELPTKPVFLVCTSAGEVGVDISADHLICDMTPFDSIAQRFGRVNRFGKRDDTEIHIVYPKKFGEKSEYEEQLKKTYSLLKKLKGDGSPAAIDALDPKSRADAFTPKPVTLPATDILFDAWALTTIQEKLPGRPPVEPYLHGIAEWEPPETHVAWREEVEVIVADLLEAYKPEDLLDDFPLKPHELLRDRTDRVFKHMQELAKKYPDKSVWIVTNDGSVKVFSLNEIAQKDKKEDLNGNIVLLPPSVGGLCDGLLDGTAESADDVSDEWFIDRERVQKRRVRVWDDDPEFDEKSKNMRLVRPPIDTKPDADEDENENTSGRHYWYWFELPQTAESEDSKNAKKPVRWQVHTEDVVKNVERFVENLYVQDDIKKALILAARFHDSGKMRAVFQRILGNQGYDADAPYTAWAKSGSKQRRLGLSEDYRHEFGSLLDIESNVEFGELSDDMKDLVRHLIAAHHGRARPHFPADEAFDPESAEKLSIEASQDVPRQFARLQRKYGRWGLAFIESLLRASDWAASAEPSEFVEKEQEYQQ
ncbi:MAG: type I-U CRISPR-associated helicase/endonuclease Cas3 [Thermoguttaceae bacterium]